MNSKINYNVDYKGILRIYINNSIICEISKCENSTSEEIKNIVNEEINNFKENIQNRIIELKGEIVTLSNLCKQLGNKEPEKNFMIKDRLELIKKLESELKDLK